MLVILLLVQNVTASKMIMITDITLNKKTGVILGQNHFLDQMMVKTIPRSILRKRGQQPETTV